MATSERVTCPICGKVTGADGIHTCSPQRLTDERVRDIAEDGREIAGRFEASALAREVLALRAERDAAVAIAREALSCEGRGNNLHGYALEARLAQIGEQR